LDPNGGDVVCDACPIGFEVLKVTLSFLMYQKINTHFREKGVSAVRPDILVILSLGLHVNQEVSYHFINNNINYMVRNEYLNTNTRNLLSVKILNN
jgi:hypothetical protein